MNARAAHVPVSEAVRAWAESRARLVAFVEDYVAAGIGGAR